jgi:hypothetical protein
MHFLFPCMSVRLPDHRQVPPAIRLNWFRLNLVFAIYTQVWRVRWTEHVIRSGDKRNVCKNLVRKIQGKRHIRKPKRK